MGFREGAYATVWEATTRPNSNAVKLKISISKKNRQTGEYEQDFSGYCMCYGDAATKAANLKERDRIKITACDVGRTYNAEQKKEYINFKIYDLEPAESGGYQQGAYQQNGYQNRQNYGNQQGGYQNRNNYQAARPADVFPSDNELPF